MGQPEAEAGGTSQRVVGTEGVGPSLTLAAMKTQYVFLAGTATGFCCTVTQTPFLITGVRQCPSRVTVTGHTVWKVSVPQGALMTAGSAEGWLTPAVASEHIAAGTGGPNPTTVAGLASKL